MTKSIRILAWLGVAVLGALALGTIALHRGEQINAMWLVVAAFCAYALGYRFYSKFISAKVLGLDARRATPAERLEDGRDFVPTNKWVLFGHHFAAIAGPGPLVGPVLAAQFGYLPGTLWILIGAVFGGCVQDFVILLFSVRRDGKSLTEMARDEIGIVGGFVAYAAVISIIVILLGVAALIALGDNAPELAEEYAAIGTAPGYYDDWHEGRDPAGISTQDEALAKRLDPVEGGRRLANYLRTMTLELQTLARACGKSHVHNLEPEDLVALTIEAAAMARVPLAGTGWIPGT